MKFYVDTSVWGGHEDKAFEQWTIPFFEQARQGRFMIILSDLTLRELLYAPPKVRSLTLSIPTPFLILTSITAEAERLANHYVNEGALSEKFISDAQHIAMSAILQADGLISWNFKHMVNFFRIKQYNAINLKFGYSTIDIRSPKEVLYGNEY